MIIVCSVYPDNNMIFLLCGTAGRDDAKVSIPATVILRYMFTPAEMRVSFEPPMVCRTLLPVIIVMGTCYNICGLACPAPIWIMTLESNFINHRL